MSGDCWCHPWVSCPPPTPSPKPTHVFQVTVLRGENASAKSLHSVVQSLESDKVKLELKVKNLELQLKENKRQLSSSSGKTTTEWRVFPAEEPFPVEVPLEGSPCVALDSLSSDEAPCRGMPACPHTGHPCGLESW